MVNPATIHTEKENYLRWKEQIIKDNPDIDEQALRDTLDGVSDIKELIVKLSRIRNKFKTRLKGLNEYIQDLKAEKTHVEAMILRYNNIIQDVMQDVGLDKLTKEDRPEGPIYFRDIEQSLKIDLEKLPNTFKTVKIIEQDEPNIALIEEHMESGKECIAGVTIEPARKSIVIKG